MPTSTDFIKHVDALRLLRSNARSDYSTTQYRNVGLRIGAAMLTSNAASILTQLLMVPLLLNAWGAALYGEWLILFTVPGYLALTDFGIISSANNRMDALCTRRRFASANRTYATSIFILTIIFFIVFAISYMIWLKFNTKIFRLFHSLTPDDISLILLILFFDTTINLTFNHHTALYRTIGQFGSTVNWQSTGRTAPMLALCGSAIAGAEPLTAAISMFSLRASIGCVLLINLSHRLNWITKSWFRISRRELIAMLSSSFGFVLLPISNMLVLHVTTLIIATATTPAGVAAFTTMRTFTRLIPQFVSIAGRALWSEITKSYARGALENIKAMKRWTLITTTGASVIAALAYLMLGQKFYIWWTRNELTFDSLLYFFMIINATLIAYYTSFEVFLLGSNRVVKYSMVFFSLSLAQLLAGWLTYGSLGLLGFPIFGSVSAFFIVVYILRNIAFTPQHTSERC